MPSDLSPKGDEMREDTLNTNWTSTLNVEHPEYKEKIRDMEYSKIGWKWVPFIVIAEILTWALFLMLIALPFWVIKWLLF